MTALPAGRDLRHIRLKYEVGGAASEEGNCGQLWVSWRYTVCVCSLRYSIAIVVLLVFFITIITVVIIIIINTDVSVCHPRYSYAAAAI